MKENHTILVNKNIVLEYIIFEKKQEILSGVIKTKRKNIEKCKAEIITQSLYDRLWVKTQQIMILRAKIYLTNLSYDVYWLSLLNKW